MNQNSQKDSADESRWLRSCIEGILFISETSIKSRELAQFLEVPEKIIEEIIKEIESEYMDKNGGFLLRKVAGGYRFYSNPLINEVLKNFVKSNFKTYLSQAALETLAIMCYMQPVTRTQIAEIRGVRTDSVFQTLVDKGLIKEAGRLKEPGNPKIYKTSDRFLEIIGINKLEEMPSIADFEDQKDEEE